jgi:uncharacterized membrane protein
MPQDTQPPKTKRLLFSSWDIIPLITLVLCVVMYVAIASKRSGAVPVTTNYQELAEGIVFILFIWGMYTSLIFIGKLAEFIPVRSIATAGALLLGLGMALHPILGSVAFGLGFGLCLISQLIGLIIVSIKSPAETPKEMPEDDPIHQAEFWRGGGIFYFNKNDKRLFVPQRYPHLNSGLVANFAHKKAWAMYIVSIFGVLIVSILLLITRTFWK